MIHRAGLRNGGRVATMFDRIVVMNAATVLLVAAAVCAAGDAKDGSAGPNKHDIALNQGVSIEKVVPDTDADRGSSTPMALPSDAEALRAGERNAPAGGQRKHKLRASSVVHNGQNARRSRDGFGLSGKKSTPSYLTGLGALAIVLVLIAVVAWAVKRWMPVGRGGGSGVLRIVGRASLSTKHTIALVQLGRRFVMVGVAGDRVAALCEVSDPDEVAELVARIDTSGKHAVPGFDHLLYREADCYREAAREDAGGERMSARENVQDARGGHAARGREAFAGYQREAVKDPAKGAERRKPLSDLLHRLRTLQIT